MKRKLFFLLALMLTSISMWAYQTPTADGTYYLYNEETGMFMSRGATWGTRANVDNYGVPIKLAASGEKYVFTAVDRNTNGYGGKYWMYSDEGTAANRILEVIAVSDGNYKLRNNLWGTAEQYVYINAGGDAGFKNLLAGNSGEQAGLAEGMYLWKFLSQSERDEIIAAKIEANNIEIASTIGYTVASTSELESLINNTNQFASTNMTSSITSASLESSTSGWTYNKEANRNKNLASNTNGTECFEGCGTLTQTVSGLKQGLYKVTINGFHRDGANTACYSREHTDGYKAVSQAYLDANGYRGQIKSWASDATSNTAPNSMDAAKTLFNAGKYLTTVYTYVGSDGKLNLTIGFPAFNESGWYIFDNVTLTYYSDAVSDEDANAIIAQAEAITGAMNAEVQATLANALSTFKSAQTIANYNALGEAVTAATNSVAAYANAKAYLDEAATILAGTNVYTAEAYDTYYSTPLAKYNAGTLTTDEGNALVKTSTGWHSANTIDDILLSSWTIGGEQCKDYEKALYINTWSVEGASDGSEFLAPFFEYWTEDTKILGANNIVATVSGLNPNATYSFTIRARVRQTNGQTKIANGVTMKVGNGEAVDISSGAKFNDTPFFIGNFSAVGETDADGKLTMTMTVAENSNISWLSFYNAKWTEGEDLSAYIADYEFAKNTAIANRDNAAYAAVTGKERVDLVNTITTYSAVDVTSKAALIEAKEALEAASNTFVTAAPAYISIAELNPNVAATLGVALPTITSETVAADLDVNGIIVAEYTAGKAYAQDFTSKLGDWTNAPGTNKGQSWDGTTGDNADTYYDEYNKTNRAMTQTVTLPAGDYALIAKGRASVNGLLTVVVGEETVTFPHKGASGYGIATNGDATFADNAIYANGGNGWGWEYRVITFTSDGSAATTLTFNWKTSGSNWCGLDDIELLCNPAALDYTALQTAYDAVEVPTLGFEAGEYAPYNNKENLENISIAKNLLDNKDADNQETIDNATAAITGMTWTANVGEQNAIYNGDFSLSTNDGAQAGWQTDHSAGLGGAGHARAFVLNPGDGNYNNLAPFGQGEGKRSCSYFRFDGYNSAKTTKYTYGATAGYTMPLKTGTVYKLTAQAGGWGQVDKNFQVAIVSSTNENVVAQNLKTPSTGLHAGGPAIDYEMYFVVPAAGDYKLVLNNPNDVDNAIVISNIVLKSTEALVFADDAAVPTYAPGTYPSVKITRTLTANKWATAVYPFAVSGVDNIAVLDSYNSETGIIGFATATESKANEPFLMRSTEGTTEISLSNVAVAATAAEPVVTKNEATLKGVYASGKVPVSEDDNVRYVVSSNQLYKVDSDVNIKPFRAYFEFIGNNEARPVLRFDDTTAINAIEAAEAESGDLKDGKYIIDNKVVIVKNGVKYGANGQKLN